MKIQCNGCKEEVNKPEKELNKTISNLGITKEDYLKIYLCKDCRKRMIQYSIINWVTISEIPNLSEPFMEKYQDKLDWFSISQYQKLSEPFMEKYKDRLHWFSISQYQKLSEPFIEKYQDKLDWFSISIHQKLSEPFIEKYKNKVDWSFISRFQNLSTEFVVKNIDEIDYLILYNPCYESYPDSLKLLLEQKFRNKI